MGLISRSNKAGSGTGNYAPNTTAKSSEVNVDVNTLYTEFNGNIDNANIKPGAAIESDKIDLTTISQNLYVNGEVQINGTLTAAALNLTGATLQLSSLQLTTSTVITGIFDEDAMTSNSASAVPTQQSVKAYVDNMSFTTGRISATGTPSSITFLRGDGAWASAGVQYVAGSYLMASADTSRTCAGTNSAFTRVKEIQIVRGGTLSISFTMADGSGSGYSGAVYRNGTIVGTVRTGAGTYVEDISGWSAGDSCQIYWKSLTTASGSVSNFRIYSSTVTIETVTYDSNI